MEVKIEGKSLYVKADEGKILVYNGSQFECAYMPLDTETNDIMEVDKPEETE